MPDKIQSSEGDDPNERGWRSEAGKPLQASSDVVLAALAEAMLEISQGGQIFHLHQNTILATDPSKHADADVIRAWLKAKSKSSFEFEVIVWLARAVRGEWAVLPHRTQSQHRELFQRIARLCRELREAMDETGALYRSDGGQGLMDVNVRQLFSEHEHAEFEAAYKQVEQIYSRSKSGNEFVEYEPELPDVDDMLERIANAAERLERQGPLHTQPNKHGAERGYFVRRIGELIAQRYGEQPLEVIAALTTIALGEATDRELVAKLRA